MTSEEFNQRIQSAIRPILVYFWAPWCGPCRSMSPRIQETANQYDGKVDLLKINADDSPDLVRNLKIMAIPTIAAYANGKNLFHKIGAQDGGALNEIFSAAAAARTPALAVQPVDRMLRAGAGLALMLVGISLAGGPTLFLILAGAVIGFTAIYDRCPIYRAVSARVKSLIRRISKNATPGQ